MISPICTFVVADTGGSEGGISSTYIEIKDFASKWDIEYDSVKWKISDFLYWQTFGGDEFINEKKLNFISQYNGVIKDAAKKYNLPEFLVAGVVYNEYGGDPMFLDDAGYAVRDFDWSGSEESDKNAISKRPELTSFGNVSIQVRRAWETLGYSEDQVTEELKKDIIESLKDPVENIYIATKHISDLLDLQYPGRLGTELTEEELIILATRYNRGPDLSLDEINQNISYGQRVINNKNALEEALKGGK